jgi:DDE family transposase
MPELVWLYLTALLYYRTSAACTALAEALETVSHDRLTRLLQAKWSGQTLLELAVRTLFVWPRGYLILDDTVLPKPFATAMEGLAWVFSSQERRPVYGFSLVLLVWTDGRLRIPLGMRLWHKGGLSKYDLALELLSYARNRLRCRPEYVLFDAWYPSKRLLKRIRDYGWYFVCRLKKNRRFNGQTLRTYRRHPYWAACGWLTGGLKVLVVRYGAKYYATNRLRLPAAEVRRLYRVRSQIEEVIRVCKDQLSLTGCQARSARAQRHHIICCLVAFCVLERERHDRHLSIYKLKRQLSSTFALFASSVGNGVGKSGLLW